MLNKKISILGCGWLGLPLAIELINKCCVVNGSTTTDVKLEKLKENKIIPFKINISKPLIDVKNFLAADILIIAITSKSVDDYIKLIEEIKKSTIKKVIFISSTSVYVAENKTVTEKSPTNGLALNTIENLFLKNKNFKTTIIRFAGLFGYDRKPGLFHKINSVIKNPEGFVNLIHRDDCINIIIAIIEKDSFGNIFNACSDHHPKRRKFYTEERIKNGFVKPTFDEESNANYKIVDSNKLKTYLNFKISKI